MWHPWRDLRGLPATIWAVALATLINRAGALFLPFLVLYLTSRTGVNEEQAGFVLTLYGIGALGMAPVGGRLVDRIGARQVMVLSLGISGVLLCAFPLAPGYVGAAAVTGLIAVACEPARTASMTMVTGLVRPDQRKASYALVRLASNLGVSVGPVAGALIQRWSFPALFVIDGLTSIAAAIVIFRMLPPSAAWDRAPVDDEDSPAADSPTTATAPRHTGPAWKDSRFLAALFVAFAIGAVFFQFESAMPLYFTHDLGLPTTVYGFVFTVNTMLIVFLEVRLNGATATWSHRRTIPLGALLVAIGFGSFAFASGRAGVYASTVAWTFGEMMFFPAMVAHVSDLAPSGRRGEYLGIYMMAFGLALSLGPWLGTIVLQRAGARVLWGGTFAVGVLAAAVATALPDPEPSRA